MKKIFLFLLLAIFALEIFSYRGIYLKKFDREYYRDLYDHSQWILPISKRTVSDEILYQVGGLDLLKTMDYFKISPEVPPLGKFIYGASIMTFGNGQIMSIVFFAFSILLFYFLSKEVIEKKKIRLLACLIFVLEPVLFSQMSQSMMDLPQLFFLLIHILAVIKILESSNKKSIWWVLVAGFSLGGFISLKIGFLALIILAADATVIYLVKKKKVLVYLPTLFFLAGLTYTIVYLPFILKSSFIEFLKAQKWVLKFYLVSAAKPLYGMPAATLLAGFIKGWHKGASFERVAEWTVLWPIYLFTFFLTLTKLKEYKKIDKKDLYLVLVVLGLIIAYSFFIPFFARYLALLIPIFILLLMKFVDLRRILYKLIFLILFIQSLLYLFPSPRSRIKAIEEVWTRGAYQDLYEFLTRDDKANISRYEFWRKFQTYEHKAGILGRYVDIDLENAAPWEKTKKGVVVVSYNTKLGPLINIAEVNFVRENNLWTLDWSDKLVYREFSVGDEIISQFVEGKIGTLRTKNGFIISESASRPYFIVIPGKIGDETKMQQELTKLTGVKKYDLEYLYKANNQVDLPVEIGFMKSGVKESTIAKMELDEGILVEKRNMRMLGSKVENIKLATLLVGKYSAVIDPQLGGRIVLKKKNGKEKVIMEKVMKDGEDMTLEVNFRI